MTGEAMTLWARPGPAAHLCIHAPDVLWNMAIGGDTAFARDYQAGKWDSDDIGALVDFAFRNDDALGSLFPAIR